MHSKERKPILWNLETTDSDTIHFIVKELNFLTSISF